MHVLLKKTRSRDGTGLFPVGFEISGVLVDSLGVEIEPSQILNGTGVFLRLAKTAFEDRPYQFATDSVINVRPDQTHWVVETVGSVWNLEKIS